MKNKINFWALAMTLLIALVVSYILCIAGGLLFGWTMVQVWAPLMPGFTWPPSTVSFLIGLLWLVVYSFYSAALIAFPYNYLTRNRLSQN